MTIKTKANTCVLPAGEYYIGDVCYAVDDGKWDSLLKDTNFFGMNDPSSDGIFFYKEQKCWVHTTCWGDGAYRDNYGNIYYVDAGLIGVMPTSACDDLGGMGTLIKTFTEPFEVKYSNGNFYISDIKIRTK